MSSDEQQEELEVLKSIYPDEFQLLTPTSFHIKLLLDPPPVAGQEDDENPPILLLHVSYPDAYPSVAPDLDITFDGDSPSSPGLQFPDDKVTLLEALQDTVEESLGMAMVFALASTLKEAAEGLISGRAEEKERIREEAQRVEEEKEMEKFRGQLVDRARFLEWRERFMEEKEADKRRIQEEEEAEGKRGQKANVKVEEKKLTGRELWERGLVGNVDEEDEGGEESIDVSKLKLGN